LKGEELFDLYDITLNPAIDHVFHIQDELTRGKNNRIAERYMDVGGKGTHVSVGLNILGKENNCTGITGENNWNELKNLLIKHQTKSSFYTVSKEDVRNNIVLTDDGGKGSFMITEYGFKINKQIIDAFFTQELNQLSSKDTVVVAGNPSLQTPVEVFAYLLDKLEKKVQLIADVSGKFRDEVLKRAVFLIKPNNYEFSEIIGEEILSLEHCIEVYQKKKSVLTNMKCISVSMGEKGSVLLTNDEQYIFNSPRVKTVNDTGSGDAYVSGLVYGFSEKLPLKDIGILATAVGAAKAEETLSTGFSKERVLELKKLVQYRKIGE
jgi:1-phosphofructokinase